MIKSNAFNILIFLIVKNIAFFIFLAFLDNRFRELVVNNSDNFKEFVSNAMYYTIQPIILSFVLITILFTPYYLTFKLRNVYLFLLFLLAVLIIEFIIYVYLTSQIIDINGFYNSFFTLAFLVLFFYKDILSLFKFEPHNP